MSIDVISTVLLALAGIVLILAGLVFLRAARCLRKASQHLRNVQTYHGQLRVLAAQGQAYSDEAAQILTRAREYAREQGLD